MTGEVVANQPAGREVGAGQRECATARRPTSGLRLQPNKFCDRPSYILICTPAAQRPRHPRVMLWSARMHRLRRKYFFI